MSVDYLKQLFSLEGKVAVVSGASRGIGRAIAEALAKAGAVVVGVGRSEPDRLREKTPFRYERCDVTNAGGFRRICTDLFQEHRHLDIYVHAAGISLSPDAGDPAQVFGRTVDVNLTAAYECALSASELMSRGDGGSIINITSIGASLGFPGNPGYVASKGGLRLLTRALALDLAPHNIRVNNIAPGYIHTAMTDKSFNDPSRYRERLQRTMLGRWGEPQDVVGAAIFLASSASSYITGQDVIVDGGWTAKGL